MNRRHVYVVTVLSGNNKLIFIIIQGLWVTALRTRYLGMAEKISLWVTARGMQSIIKLPNYWLVDVYHTGEIYVKGTPNVWIHNRMLQTIKCSTQHAQWLGYEDGHEEQYCRRGSDRLLFNKLLYHLLIKLCCLNLYFFHVICGLIKNVINENF